MSGLGSGPQPAFSAAKYFCGCMQSMSRSARPKATLNHRSTMTGLNETLNVNLDRLHYADHIYYNYVINPLFSNDSGIVMVHTVCMEIKHVYKG